LQITSRRAPSSSSSSRTRFARVGGISARS
jgi:hypothetical protein